MKTNLFIPALLTLSMISTSSCEKNSSTTLKILTSPTGQNQAVTANIDNKGYTNFGAQTVLAEGGNPLENYTWSLDIGSTPAGVTIGALTGVINRIGTTSTGLKVGNTPLKVTVSDVSTSVSGTIDLKVSSYTPGPAAVFQQLSSPFQLMDGTANKAYGASLFAMGGTPPFSWKLDASYAGSVDLTLAGLSISGTGGIVKGTIMNSTAGKIIKFKVVVTDKTGTVAVYSPVYTIVIK